MLNLPMKTRVAAGLARHYPAMSGRGTIANSTLMKYFDASEPVDTFADVAAGSIKIPTHDYVGRTILYFGDLDLKISTIINRVVSPGDVTLDIGANLGIVSLHLAQSVGPHGHVHAFEPSPLVIPYLTDTINSNPDLRITHHGIALGREQSKLFLHIPPRNAGEATLMTDGAKNAMNSVEVSVETLSTFAATQGLTQIDFIKIDVEGFEAEVLAGGKALLDAHIPKAILFEEHSFSRTAALPSSLELLSGCGYELYAITKSLFGLKIVPLTNPRADSAHDFLALAPDTASLYKSRLQI